MTSNSSSPRALLTRVLLVSSILSFSCTTAPKNIETVVATDPEVRADSSQESYQDEISLVEPINILESKEGFQTLAILGTNDIHGALTPEVALTRETEGTPQVRYEAAGGAALAAYVRILRKEFGERLIWLDAGDEFQGSFESNMADGAPMVQLFNASGLDYAAVGNHEFDFGLTSLKSRMSEARYSYLAANILDKQTRKHAVFPNTYPSKLFTVGKLRVGVFGLSTLDTPKTTLADNVKTLAFEDLKEAALRETHKLRKQGAQVILLVAHAGSTCSAGRMSQGRMIRKPTDPQGECNDHDEIVQLLHSLPADTVDAVVSGHTHQVIHHWIAGVPVVQAGAFGRYLNIIYLTYDWTKMKLLPEQTRIEGPVPVCVKVFKNQNDCNGDRPAPKNGRGPLVAAKFHGKTIHPDSKVEDILAPIIKRSELKKMEVLGKAATPLDHLRTEESPLGNLVADAVRASAQTDISLVNSGGIRAPLKQGAITFGDVFKTLPFENMVAVLHVTGTELKSILRVAQSGSRGFPPVSGLKLRIIDPNLDAPWDDLDGSGKDEPWKTNRLIDATLSNGDPILPNKIYTLATLDFLVTGGDDLGWPMSLIPQSRITLSTGVRARDALIEYIQKHKATLNTEDRPLVDKSHPRIKFEKPAINYKKHGKKQGKKHRRSRRHQKSAE